MISTDKKQTAIKSVQVHDKDTGGSGAQVAVLTERIKELTEHLKQNKHDFMARRGLLQILERHIDQRFIHGGVAGLEKRHSVFSAVAPLRSLDNVSLVRVENLVERPIG